VSVDRAAVATQGKARGVPPASIDHERNRSADQNGGAFKKSFSRRIREPLWTRDRQPGWYAGRAAALSTRTVRHLMPGLASSPSC